MIDPRLVTLQDLFADRIHYEVPIFQRPYVWEKDEQWIPLWEDVVDAANGRLAGQPMLAHFLGRSLSSCVRQILAGSRFSR
ncbi:MAG TPA: DUF262 domain-containing protein [Solirubrobacteraceae bacterium]|jgi:uncharacterized protein with ParB-like and HNH nuclease domain|nr:DUF262 domain-containing protein [Solirubrobacteraceae bacterium]